MNQNFQIPSEQNSGVSFSIIATLFSGHYTANDNLARLIDPSQQVQDQNAVIDPLDIIQRTNNNHTVAYLARIFSGILNIINTENDNEQSRRAFLALLTFFEKFDKIEMHPYRILLKEYTDQWRKHGPKLMEKLLRFVEEIPDQIKKIF